MPQVCLHASSAADAFSHILKMAGGAGERLHIGLVVPGFSANERDWCIPALLTLVRRLVEDHDVTVYALRYPDVACRYTVGGARVCSFGWGAAGGRKRLGLLWRAVNTITADAAQKPFSLLHGLWADEPGFISVLAGRRLGIPAIVSLMGGELVRLPEIGYGVQLSYVGRLMTLLSLRLADMVSAGSQQLLERAGPWTSARRVRQLPLGVDLTMFTPGPSTPAPPYRIVHAGSLTAVKDQDTLLTAFAGAAALLAPEKATLQVAGDGPLHTELEARARALGVGDLVQWLGEVPHEEMPAFYRRGHLFVLSSRHESQSVALLEAGACGLPAVGTAVGLLPQVLAATQLAPAGDAYRLGHCMANLLQDREGRQREARRMAQLVRGKYGLETCVEGLLQTYEETLVRRRSPA